MVWWATVFVFCTLLIAGINGHATLSLHGNGAEIVWKDGAGDPMVSLKRNGSVVELDAPLHAQDLHAGNVSLADALAQRLSAIANHTAEVEALRSTLAELELQGAGSASTWDVNGDWFDLELTSDGALKGFWGGVYAEGFVYFGPNYNGSNYHGYVVRINPSDFSSSGMEFLDLGTVNPVLRGYRGVCFDGDFVYLTPYKNDFGHHGNIVRINVSDFTPSGVEWFDLATSVAPGLQGFEFGFVSGGFAYYSPYYDGSNYHGAIPRVNTSNFSAGGVEWFDLASVHSSLKGFRGGFAEGAFAYYVPYYNGSYHGLAVRVNMSNFSTHGVQWFDVAATVHGSLVGFLGGFSSPEFAYYVPFQDSGGHHGRVARIRTDQFSPIGVEWFDLAATVDATLKGFVGGFVAGGYAYYAPHQSDYGCRVVRITVSDFAPSGTQWFSLQEKVYAGFGHFYGAFPSDGFAYMVPGLFSGFNGLVARVPL